jgi:hypothetical protein
VTENRKNFPCPICDKRIYKETDRVSHVQTHQDAVRRLLEMIDTERVYLKTLLEQQKRS